MKKIEKIINEYFSSFETHHYYYKLKVNTTIKDFRCTVHLEKMNDELGDIMSFANLKWLAELLNTDNINIKNERHMGGCETCDYGALMMADIVCDDIEIEQHYLDDV